LWTSFQPESLRGAARIAPHLPRGLLLHEWRDDVFDHLLDYGHQALICRHTLWTPERCDQAALRGIWRVSYTVNDPEVAQQLWRWGHEAIITDAVDVFHPLR
jgi:glycerophosphoryl diester phosphodiesterase